MVHTKDGTVINPFNFRADDITVEQLAHALACQNRYYGHTSFPISIAQHAVAVSKLVSDYAMQGLHHDDSEALIGDVNKWLKETNSFADYRMLEDIIQTEFFKKFKCPLELHPSVAAADKLAAKCEMALGFNRFYKLATDSAYTPPTTQELNFFIDLTNFKVEISWKEARDLFLERHAELEKLQ